MRELSQEAEACRQLFLAVVLQAARDLLGADSFELRTLDRHQARMWLGSRDFRATCQAAGLDAGQVERALRRRDAERVGRQAHPVIHRFRVQR